MWAYSNNGVSYRTCGDANQIDDGEVFFDHTPSNDELLSVFPNYAEAKAENDKEVAKTLRATAYKDESDPVFFKWQRGEATQQEWLDKVAEIKARYPK